MGGSGGWGGRGGAGSAHLSSLMSLNFNPSFRLGWKISADQQSRVKLQKTVLGGGGWGGRGMREKG